MSPLPLYSSVNNTPIQYIYELACIDKLPFVHQALVTLLISITQVSGNKKEPLESAESIKQEICKIQIVLITAIQLISRITRNFKIDISQPYIVVGGDRVIPIIQTNPIIKDKKRRSFKSASSLPLKESSTAQDLLTINLQTLHNQNITKSINYEQIQNLSNYKPLNF